MKEIKFRAWCEMDKCMVYDLNSPVLRNWELIDPDGTNYLFLQYTWLKDKNGKEIYEGDKLRDEDWEIYEVIYMWRWFRLMKTIQTIPVYRDYENYLCCEHIWNIYENPELWI